MHLPRYALPGILGSLLLATTAFAAPVNDNFASRIVLSGSDSITTSGTNVGATKESGEPNHGNNAGGASVWWSWTAPTSGLYTIKTIGSNFDTTLGIYTGTAVNSLTSIGQDDDSGGNSTSLMSVNVTSGATYQIAVDGYSGSTGSIVLAIDYPQPPPANDSFGVAMPLASGAISVNGTNVGASKESGEPAHGGYAGGRSVWYSWTAPSSGEVWVQTSNSTVYTLVGAYTGASVNALTTVASSAFGSIGAFQAVGGVTYRIAVDDYYAVGGTFTLSVSAPVPPPANDDFGAAAVLPSGGGTLNGSNTGATKESGEPNHASEPGGRSVWYVWTAPSSGEVNVRLSNIIHPAVVGIYSGASVNGLIELASAVGVGVARFQAVGGATYRIAVDSSLPTSGSFTLTVSDPVAPPANDGFASGTVLNGVPRFVSGTTSGASKEAGEPNHGASAGGRSVWYVWTAPATATFHVSVVPPSGNSMNALLGIYTGFAVNSLTQVVAGSGSSSFSTALNATQGVTYQIAVDASFGSGSFVLGISQPPPNDQFANATDLGTASSGSNSSWIDLSVSYENGEPDAPAFFWLTPIRSIWWKWTAPSDGWVSFDTLGSGTDTIMEVFTGSSVVAETLTLIAKNGDASEAGENSLAFQAVSGTTYHIRVRDDESRQLGVVSLHFSTLGVPVTAADHVRLGRANLQLQTDVGLSGADAAFAAALAIDANHAEANFFKAITGFAMLEQGAAFQNALSGLGILDSNIYERAHTFPKDGIGNLVATPGTHTSAGIDYLTNSVLPALGTIRSHLSKASSPAFITSFSDSESTRSYLKIDAGDVGAIKAATYALEAVIRLLQTFDAGMSVADAISDYNAGQLNAEKAIETFAGLLNSTGNNQRVAFKNAIQSGMTEYTAASEFVRNFRVGGSVDHLCPLEPKDFEAEQKIMADAQSASQSLDGPTLIGSETTDLSKFVTSTKSLREQLPVLVGDKAVASTAPDPTFDGTVPNATHARVNDFLRKKGLLHEVQSFSSWASAFLKGLSPADQAKGANPDRDLLNNFAEYAFNLHPGVPSAPDAYQVNQLMTNVSDGKKYLHLTFVRRIVRPDISYVVAVSDDLATWDRTQVQVQQVGIPVPYPDGQTESVTFRLLASPEVINRKFIRVEVTDLAP
ncbi:MAG: hypothetical protein IAE77_10580 [Prosthecobacter sp.]|jgi:hypothetical protein|uniref:hypothetical protein n=1 Tax=Prosthecobacter sp. TaxID=1965333 RepID=UPI001A08A080|nr:hypothetical protein [Prosthecobacter sp.]MBE2283890.1 hypothetical protein [Prosthecobacter sp.]